MSRPTPRPVPARRIDAQWHRSGKTLDLVIGMVHLTLTEEEAQRLHDRLETSISLPSEKRVRIDDARKKLNG